MHICKPCFKSTEHQRCNLGTSSFSSSPSSASTAAGCATATCNITAWNHMDMQLTSQAWRTAAGTLHSLRALQHTARLTTCTNSRSCHWQASKSTNCCWTTDSSGTSRYKLCLGNNVGLHLPNLSQQPFQCHVLLLFDKPESFVHKVAMVLRTQPSPSEGKHAYYTTPASTRYPVN